MSEEEPPELVNLDNDESLFGKPGAVEKRKVPITLLTGYLGAGKSTLLEYILTADHGYKIAVCMNDFGDTADIEAKALTLTDPKTGEQTTSFLSLPNGCLCCSVKDMGIAAIEQLTHQEDVDWVMVELTGVADPAPIAKSFWANEEMGELILDGVICVVDSRNVLKQVAEIREQGQVNECQKQVACADVILLNKVDLVTRGVLEEVTEAIKEINPTLRVHETTRSQISLDEIFNLHAYTTRPLATNLASTHAHTKVEEVSHSHPAQSVHPTVSTVLIPLPELSNTQYDQLQIFLETLIWDSRLPGEQVSSKSPPDILRTKGIIYTSARTEFIIQGVTDIFEITALPTSASNSESDRVGKIVFIGRNLDHIQAALYEYIGISG